ncbi:acyltransferase [Halobacillus sp. BBL2006]|uniref:acyltransferase n=1 Tax=Halobacillus sp. BBL2006 TaxID=1543706 RepID=UPI000AE82F01|nr:acyltransferase [Halobacillus sp. BBL2006]
MKLIRKLITTLASERKNRGFYFTFVMNTVHCIGIFRGVFFKVLYLNQIECSIFSLQSNSSIEIFNRSSKVTIGKFVFIRKNASLRVDYKGHLKLGDHVFINDNCNINCVNKVTIGSYSKIASGVSINDHDHNYKQSNGDHLLKGEVHIGKNVWIGSNVTILRNTTIGDNSVIAAGSVVKGNIPDNTVFVIKRENKHIPIEEKRKVQEIS